MSQDTPKAIERPDIRMADENWLAVQRYLGKNLLKSGHGMVLPKGVVIDSRPWQGFKHSVQVQSFVMNTPRDLLVDPDDRCQYCWRPREDGKHQTEGLVNAGKLIPVDFDRVDMASPLAMWVYDYSGTKVTLERDEQTGRVTRTRDVTGLVAMGNYALFEVPPEMTWEWYEQPTDAAFAALRGTGAAHADRAEEWANRTRGMQFKGADMTVTDAQKVPGEIMNPRSGGPPIAPGAE